MLLFYLFYLGKCVDMIYFFVTPIIGAIIGYSTNWLAIRMLLRPHRPVYLLGKRLPFTPGVIPKEQKRLAKKVAKAIEGHILTPEVLAKEFMEFLRKGGLSEDIFKGAAKEYLPKAAGYIREYENLQLDEQASEWLKKLIQEHVGRLAGMFLDHQKIYNSMKDGIVDYLSQEENIDFLSERIEEILERFLDSDSEHLKKALNSSAFEKVTAHVAKHINIEAMIEKQINEFEPEKAEELLLSVIKRELHIVMALGGVLGFIIGWIPVLLN